MQIKILQSSGYKISDDAALEIVCNQGALSSFLSSNRLSGTLGGCAYTL